MKMASKLSLLALLFLFHLVSSASSSEKVILEDGYTVSTVINGHKLNINPYSVISPFGSSDLIVLDSENSLFYTVSLPLSQESTFKRLSGDAKRGYSDGEPGSARFDKPRSFAVDAKGNVYVADKNNHVIRKITNSGVTTIAGNKTKTPGHDDGPALNAAFSADFELAFVPSICALMISDHGTQLVSQINLKAEDCARSPPPSAMGSVSVWVLGLTISCILGAVFGILIHPYVTRYEGLNLFSFNVTWKSYLINLAKQVQTLCFDIRSAAANSTFCAILKELFWLSIFYISLIFRMKPLESKTPPNNFVSLLDSDVLSSGHETEKSDVYVNQLKDLVTFDGNQDLSSTQDIITQGDENQGRSDAVSNSYGKLDNLLQANVDGFGGVAEETSPRVGSVIGNSGNPSGVAEETSPRVGSVIGNSGNPSGVAEETSPQVGSVIGNSGNPSGIAEETSPRVGSVIVNSGLVRKRK